MLQVVFLAIVVGGFFYLRKFLRTGGETALAPHPQLTEDQIKQKWRELGFFCELDDQRRKWILTGSRRGLLYFPDLLLGYTNDPANERDGTKKHFGPYGSLEIMTYPEPGFDSHAIRGSLQQLTHLAEMIEMKLATAEPGETIRIREEYAEKSPYALELDIRADGFDPASTDRERLGATAVEKKPPPPKPPA
jgi:hypothetical protein